MSELSLVSVPGASLTPEGALLRVLLVPRLQGVGTTLADYGMQDWPALITGATFDVVLRTAAGVDLPTATVAVQTEARSDVWAAFFSAITVTPFSGQPVYDAPVVTPSTDHAEQVVGAYNATTAAVGDPTSVHTELQKLSFQVPPPAPDAAAPATGGPAPDFHRAVALLREHPPVLRALGLIVELHVARALLDQCGTTGSISVGWPAATAQFSTVTTPRTRYEIVDGRFLPAGAGLIRAGQVDLTTVSDGLADWTVQTVDLDSAVARLSSAKSAATVVASAGGAGATPDPTTLPMAMPALRSMGLQLTHRGRQAMFEQRTARARVNSARALTDPAADLTADDLVLGYRLDVREGGGSWFSMMRRQSSYAVGGVPITGPVAEEGHVKAAAAVRGTDGALYADEVVVRWDGSRLAVPVAVPGTGPASGAARQVTGASPPYDFSWTFTTDPEEPAGAPELRFSHSYQLRLRVADLAGGGLSVEDVPGEAMAAPLKTYARHESVQPPEMPPPPDLLETVDGRHAVVHEDVLGPGGALERIVVRSDPAGDTPLAEYPPNAQRVLLPPAAAFTLAEWEDVLTGADVATWRLARRALAAPRASAEPRDGRQYTWLPDPAADGVSMTVLPLSTRVAPLPPRVRTWISAAWPDHPGKTVLVHPGAPGTSLTADWASDTDAGISLPPATRATVEIASAVDSVYFGRFAAASSAPTGSTAQQAVITGRHPVVTPARRLEVVHAVRRPLSAPAATLLATRASGATSAQLADPDAPLLGVDRDSTLQLDVAATWDEPRDTAADTASGFAPPTTVTHALGSLPVELDAATIGPIHHEFGDTRHRTVTYRIAARSRFRDFFGPAEPEAAFIHEATLAPVDVPSTTRPSSPTVLGLAPAFATDSPSPGVLRRSGGTLRVELAGPWFTTGADEQLGVVVSPAAGLPPIAWESGVTGGAADASGALAHLVTTVYRDPVVATAVPGQPDSSSLTGPAGSPCVVRDLESGAPICVVPFDVFRRGDRLFADIGFGTLADQRSSAPMVRLSLVRFQRHSLPTLTSSPIVHTDLVNVLPARLVQAVTTAGSLTVTLTGHGPSSVVDLRLEATSQQPATSDLTTLDAALPGWSVVGIARSVLNQPFPPVAVPNDGRSYRIVVREFADVSPSAEVTSADPLVAGLAAKVLFAGVLPL